MNKSNEKSIPELDGQIMDTDPSLGYSLLETLIYYDGPLLTLDENPDGLKALTVWMDVEEANTPNQKDYWGFVPLSNEDSEKLLSNKMTLLEVILKNEFLYIEEIGEDENKTVFRKFISKEFPKSRLPAEGVCLTRTQND
jgi:hypothetical protein